MKKVQSSVGLILSASPKCIYIFMIPSPQLLCRAVNAMSPLLAALVVVLFQALPVSAQGTNATCLPDFAWVRVSHFCTV
jgi:hypothetical protein